MNNVSIALLCLAFLFFGRATVFMTDDLTEYCQEK